jgi:hypothetical protein
MSLSRARVFVVTVLLAVVSALLVGAVSGTAMTAAGATTHGPLVHAPGVPKVGSYNWSGYAVTSTTTPFNYVHSRWVVPAITCYGVKNQDTSNWVGLDGATNGTVEQDGTGAACKGPNHETPIYYAWYELYPANSVTVFKVAPGDTVDSYVQYVNGQFTLGVSDLTSGRTATHSATCSACARSSAEWIIERPATCKSVDPLSGCQITELANFGSTTMSQNTASQDGGKVSAITAFGQRLRIDIVDPEKSGLVALDDTGPLGGFSFTVTWLANGKPVPITL